MDTAIIVAFVAAAAGLASHLVLRWRENETRRLQLIRDLSAQQISEFYAPLSALIEQLDATATICDGIEGRDKDKPEISKLIHADSFAPLHEEIVSILKSKVHLAEGRQVPPSVVHYLHHYRAQRTQEMLQKAGLSVSVKDPGFPSKFYDDVMLGLAAASARYEETVEQLRAPIFGSFWQQAGPAPPTANGGGRTDIPMTDHRAVVHSKEAIRPTER
jgi:hypothetical protein